MFRRALKVVAGGAVVALALWLTGCGDSNSTSGNPKVTEPPAGGKDFKVQTPPGTGGGGDGKAKGGKTGGQ